MAFVIKLTREQFVAWMGSNAPVPRAVSEKEYKTLKDGEILLVWKHPSTADETARSRPVLGVRPGVMKDFVAFVTTFLVNYHPFSAFFRTVPFDILLEVIENEDRYQQKPTIPNHLIGAVIAEARSQIGNRVRSPSDLSIQSCLATCSYPAIALLSAGFSADHLVPMFDTWMATRERLSEERLRLPIIHVAEFWQIVAGVYGVYPLKITSGPPLTISRFITEVVHRPDDADLETWSVLTDGLPNTRKALALMREAREDRVRALDDLIPEILSNDGVDRRIREVAAGYLASRISGGSLRYLQLLGPLEALLPIAPMWFGLFASLRKDTDALTAGDCLGRRVVRQLERTSDIFDPPDADISAGELEALLPDPRSELKFRTQLQGSISVEVFPTITATFRLPKDVRKETEAQQIAAPRFPPDAIREIRYLLDRLMRSVNELQHPIQPGLFDEGSKTRTRTRTPGREK